MSGEPSGGGATRQRDDAEEETAPRKSAPQICESAKEENLHSRDAQLFQMLYDRLRGDGSISQGIKGRFFFGQEKDREGEVQRGREREN